MVLSTAYWLVLAMSISFLIAQLFVKNKQTSHILFAIFCGSIALFMTKQLSGNSLGAYQYLIGMGACATCNGYWLLSRCLFRKKNPIELHHLALAIVISILILLRQGYLFATTSEIISASSTALASHILAEITVLLSSCILVLSLWEGCRGFKTVSHTEQKQRVLFVATLALAIITSKLSQGVFADNIQSQLWVQCFIIAAVLISTQVLLLWRQQSASLAAVATASLSEVKPINTELNNAEQQLASEVQSYIEKQKLYLQANLKVADLARILEVSEYRISRVIKHHFKSKNFNQYVNELRIEHAKQLLLDPSKKQWPVLVIGLESGFASNGPFTRAFKAQTGCTPAQYRLEHNNEALQLKIS